MFSHESFCGNKELKKKCLSPMHEKVRFEKSKGQPQEFWFLVLTIDGSTLPKDCVEE